MRKLQLIILFASICTIPACKKNGLKVNGSGSYFVDSVEYPLKVITRYSDRGKDYIHIGAKYFYGVDDISIYMNELPLKTGTNLIHEPGVSVSCDFHDIDALLKGYELAESNTNSIVIKTYNKHKDKLDLEFDLTFVEDSGDSSNHNGPPRLHMIKGKINSEIHRYYKRFD